MRIDFVRRALSATLTVAALGMVPLTIATPAQATATVFDCVDTAEAIYFGDTINGYAGSRCSRPPGTGFNYFRIRVRCSYTNTSVLDYDRFGPWKPFGDKSPGICDTTLEHPDRAVDWHLEFKN
ncbi:hypothetical protein D5S17_17720 [Pseudonocardiaceae bacterium YIM PH 21723]|nr:hypothetical protein D5S17_17720 [Pseudonocardiaceae bacterium YIM PH 21723]